MISQLPEISNKDYPADNESDDFLDLCSAEGKLQLSARGKLNSPESNLPKGWVSPTIAHETSGRKYQWLGPWGRSIGP